MTCPPLRHWLLGLALSLAVTWAAGAPFLDTVQPVWLDPAVGRYMPQPGTVMRYRSEGFARTTVGDHGFRSLPGGILPPGPKAMFWGDSYVEALQVDDAAHMDQIFSRLAAQNGMNLSGVGLGVSGDSIIDTYFRLPMYAKILSPVALHVFVVAKSSDIMPDFPNTTHSEFHTRPDFNLSYNTATYSRNHLRFGWLVRALELSGPYRLLRNATSLTLRLVPGPEPATTQQSPPALSTSRLGSAWNFLLSSLKRQSPEPMLIVYLPSIPQLHAGSLRPNTEDAPTMDAFALACARNGVGYLDLGPRFVDHYLATGRFPRGFFNTPPGTGHLNEDGHRMVAEAVLKYIKEHRDALLAP